jgi:hypothetical protein
MSSQAFEIKEGFMLITKTNQTEIVKALLVLLTVGFTAACGQPVGLRVVDNQIGDAYGLSESPRDSGFSGEPLAPPPGLSGKFEALSWESANPKNKTWSEYLYKVIDQEELVRLDKAGDTDHFCKNYSRFSREQKINFWGALISGMAKFESAYNPLSRMTEDLGTDSITGRQVSSEGLLQLSYQDIKGYKFCEFDWNKDRNLNPKDPRKTILDPYKNLRCGIKILGRQVERKGNILLRSGVYWSVIAVGHRNEKISAITGIVRKLSFCK